MLGLFKPTWSIADIYSIQPKFLLENHINNVLTDLDNTLIPWDSSNGNKKLENWLTELKKNGIAVIVVSNNSHSRIEMAVKEYNLPFIARAMKPLNIGIKQAKKRFSLDLDSTVMVGDQLLTDIFSANICHVRSILVKPLVRSDKWNTRVNRVIENQLWKYLEKKYDLHWE